MGLKARPYTLGQHTLGLDTVRTRTCKNDTHIVALGDSYLPAELRREPHADTPGPAHSQAARRCQAGPEDSSPVQLRTHHMGQVEERHTAAEGNRQVARRTAGIVDTGHTSRVEFIISSNYTGGLEEEAKTSKEWLSLGETHRARSLNEFKQPSGTKLSGSAGLQPATLCVTKRVLALPEQ